jgi:hypothetical protein
MTYDFFADRNDKLQILEFIFNETDLRVYDSASAYGKEISEYKNAAEIASAFDLLNGGKFSQTFQLWTPRHAGKPVFRKIDLDPKHCNGHTFRYATDGWGLIQLYFGGIQANELHESHIGHFNEKGALKNERANSFNGPVADWHWSEIQKTSTRLKYHIQKKLAVRSIGSFGILEGADQLSKSGIVLK